MEAIDDPGRTYSAETILHCRDGSQKEVVISVSLVSYAEQEGKIIVVKELSPRQQMKRNSDQLSSELQSSLLLMQQPIGPRVKALRKCSASTTIREAAEIMARKDVDIIFVTQEDRIIGVVTDSDLRRRVVASSAEPGMPVMEIMTSPVISIGGHALIYEAIILMKEQGISHLAVKNSKHEITGVIYHADLADLQHNVISVLFAEINVAEETDQLASLYDRLPVLVKTLLESGDRLDHLTRIISSVNDAIHQRVIALAIEEASTPPCRFAFLVMGSEGRKEQTLATDQDNAIVFDDLPVEQEKAVQEYFRNLGGRINEMLHTIGYQYCKGEVMARNPRWTQSLSTWKKYFTDWIQTGNPHDILEASIFFDFRNVYGDGQLVTELREHVNSVAKNRAVFFYHMAQAVLKFKSPMNLFGKIVGNTTNDDALNLDMKKSLFPVIAFLRLYAIREQLSETNSMDRAVRLLEKQVIEQSLYEDLQQAYHFMSALRLRSQVRDIIENNPPGNMVDLHQLSRIEVNTLKQVLSGISELQTKVSFDFKGAE